MYDVTRDIPNQITYTLENGNTLRANRTDPYGFWYLSLEKGQLPDGFKGAYSTIEQLKQAVDQYAFLRKQVLTKTK